MLPKLFFVTAVVAVASLAACGKDGSNRTYSDAFVPGDGNVDSATDAGVDAGDSGVFPTMGCTVNSVDLLDDQFGSDLELRLAATPNGMIAAWLQQRSMANPIADAYSLFVRADGTFGTGGKYATGNATLLHAPTIAASGTNVLYAWSETYYTGPTFGFRYDLSTRVLDSSGASSTTTIQATNNAAIADVDATALGLSTGNFLVVFSQEDSPSPRTSHAGVVDATGNFASAPTPVAIAPASQPALARSGTAVLAAYAPADSSVVVVPMTEGGALAGSVQPITAALVASNDIEVAMASSSAGLVVWDTTNGGTKREVYYRVVTAAGVAVGLAKTLQGPTMQEGEGVSVTSLAGGYLIAYRGTQDNGATWKVRVAIVDASGLLIADQPVADLTSSSGQISIRASSSGDVYAVWSDARTGGGLLVRGGRLTCQ